MAGNTYPLYMLTLALNSLVRHPSHRPILAMVPGLDSSSVHYSAVIEPRPGLCRQTRRMVDSAREGKAYVTVSPRWEQPR